MQVFIYLQYLLLLFYFKSNNFYFSVLVEAFFWIIDAESQAHYHGEVAVKKHSTFLVFREIQKRLFQLIPHISFFHGQVAFLRTAVGNAHCRYLVQHDIADHFFEEYCEGKSAVKFP